MQNQITLNLMLPVFAVKILEKSGYLPLKTKSIEAFSIYALLYTNSSNVVFEQGSFNKSRLPCVSANLEIKIPPYTNIDYHPDRLRIIQLHLVNLAKQILFEGIRQEEQNNKIEAVRKKIAYYEIEEDEYPMSSIIRRLYD